MYRQDEPHRCAAGINEVGFGGSCLACSAPPGRCLKPPAPIPYEPAFLERVRGACQTAARPVVTDEDFPV